MKYFLRLNIIGILLAAPLFIWATTMLNVYRINRVLNVNFSTINLVAVAIFIAAVISVPWVLKMKNISNNSKKLDYILVVLWFPYFKVMENIFYYLFPFTDRGDLPAQVLGLVLLLAFLLYPIYILITLYLRRV
ncbi:hypothetical protein [Amphibacillus jilinensis]|uniref:hypothetical protein n=1 Tax=Amphibacillus jilinensis TaxID=1216008 RepID=UPI0003151303|nr:hypothetical protein [Amphibacillus jilinensis]